MSFSSFDNHPDPVCSAGEFRPVAAKDPRLTQLLAENGLVTEDLESAPAQFWMLEQDAEILAAGGIERAGSERLIRSLVVAENARNSGVGASILLRLEEIVRADTIDRVWILTTTAERFFAGRGYSLSDLRDAPPEIRATEQASSLCGADAILMVKRLLRSTQE